jgi:tetratricopeptide (TPR) repeat protein
MYYAVRQIVQSLTRQEYLVVSRLIAVGKSEAYSKILSELRNSEKTDIASFQERIGHSGTLPSFQKTIVRFRRKLNEALNSNLIIEGDKDRAMQFVKKYQLRQDLTVVEMLLSKGLDSVAVNDLHEIERMAGEYELFSIQLEAVVIRSAILGQGSGFTGYSEANQIRSEALEGLLATIEADRLWYSTCDHIMFASKSAFSVQEIREGALLLNELYLKTGSEEVNYLHVRTQMYVNELNGQPAEAIRNGQLLLSHWKTSSKVASKLRVGNLHLNICDACLMVGEYVKAIDHAHTASTCFKEGHFNSLLALEQKFFAFLYLGRTQEAAQTILLALKNTNKKLYDLDFARREYFRDCATFLSDTGKSLPISILGNSVLDSDAQGFGVHVRLLIGISLIDLGRHDDAMSLIENMDQNIRYHKKRGVQIRKRLDVILFILRKLSRAAFDFKKMASVADELALLQGQEPEYRWLPCGPELVMFHYWVQARSRNITYQEFLTN